MENNTSPLTCGGEYEYRISETYSTGVTKTCMGNCCSPAVAGDVYDGVFFVLSFFPRDVLDEILDLTETGSEGFPTYSCTSFLNCLLLIK